MRWRRSGRGRRSAVEMDADELARADTLAFGGVGFAAQPLPATEAYRRLEAALPEQADQVRAAVDRLLAEGSPAGRAYAATLLGRIDPTAARAAWARLADADGEFTTFSGCVMGRRALRDHAAEQLTAE
ncbi:hypothetical protein O7606_18420 [Micromonospora sp. WMMD882]|uniref:hypothetical protein n=1 Tax=Micromonospora sp. WMMD882 TaxID=3015151 RepID=UPI00248D085B|nr:hypothetical protein [Micromonospora sp. WMMD882]WBB78203.1 hypothetical protein O7606_18420 [Micromonospora sp. WMMD882]